MDFYRDLIMFKYSIIIPTHKRVNLLERAINSIKKQIKTKKGNLKYPGNNSFVLDSTNIKTKVQNMK